MMSGLFRGSWWIACCILLPATLFADVYRWDNGQVISGTERVTVGPGVSLAHLDLDYAAIQQRDLTGADFSSSDLFRADLSASTLTGANLTGANLYLATLRDSVLLDANLSEAVISYALLGNTTAQGFTAEQLYSTDSYQQNNLQWIKLDSNDLSGWDFHGQDLFRADFRGSDLTGANFAGANLTHSYLSATLADTDLTEAVITGADLRGATASGFTAEQLYSTANYQQKKSFGFLKLENNDLTGWDLHEQDFAGAWIVNSNLTEVNFSASNLAGAVFRGSTLNAADLSDAVITRSTFDATDDLSPQQFYSTANYRQQKLQGISLGSIDLSGWDFTGQNLAGASFSGATLQETTFADADVRGAYFGGSSLQKEQLYSTASYQQGDLSGIAFAGNNLRNWDLSGQNLSNASLRKATLIGMDLTNAEVIGADFDDTGLTAQQLYSTASYQRKNLRRIDLSRVHRTDWDLSGQDISGATFWRAYLSETDFSGAVIAGADFENTVSRGFSSQQLYTTANYQQQDLRDVVLNANDLTGWDFRQQDLRGASFSEAILTDTDFAGAKVEGTDFSGTVSAGFTDQQLYATRSYQQQDLRGIVLSWNDLAGWNFRQQNLTSASFRQADLTGTDFTDANLTAADLRDATGFAPESSTTTQNMIWPNGEVHGLVLNPDESFQLGCCSWNLADRHWVVGESVFVTERFAVAGGATLEFPMRDPPTISGSSSITGNLIITSGTDVDLGGTLRVRSPEPWQPAPGYRVRLFRWSSPLDADNVFTKIELPAGLRWDVSHLYTEGWISVLEVGELGDFDVSHALDQTDITRLSDAVLQGDDLSFDVNRDGQLDAQDRHMWVKELKHTYFGDANLDGAFNTSDFVQVLTAGKYETQQGAVWAEGDWDGDGFFETNDLVKAFEDGGYEKGPQNATKSVPEPMSIQLLILGFLAAASGGQRWRQ